jgi:S-adenosylmethionine synthetase
MYDSLSDSVSHSVSDSAPDSVSDSASDSVSDSVSDPASSSSLNELASHERLVVFGIQRARSLYIYYRKVKIHVHVFQTLFFGKSRYTQTFFGAPCQGKQCLDHAVS